MSGSRLKCCSRSQLEISTVCLIPEALNGNRLIQCLRRLLDNAAYEPEGLLHVLKTYLPSALSSYVHSCCLHVTMVAIRTWAELWALEWSVHYNHYSSVFRLGYIVARVFSIFPNGWDFWDGCRICCGTSLFFLRNFTGRLCERLDGNCGQF
jgi:hypothetical protein